MNDKDFDRFTKFVQLPNETGCMLWSGCIMGDGYGSFCLDGKMFLAHRVAYQHFVGEIPDGLEIDHLCRVRACVNPSHLEPVTSRENTLRGFAPASLQARRTHCKRGHLLVPGNIYLRKDKPHSRECRLCARERQRKKCLARSK